MGCDFDRDLPAIYKRKPRWRTITVAPLYVSSNPQKSDVIVLLSSGQIDEDWLTPDASLQRVLGAIKLYREHYAPVIISSGKPVSIG